MDNPQESPRLCQRCRSRPATRHFDWPSEMSPEREDRASETSAEDYLLAYQHLCEPCFESVFRPTVFETVEDLVNVLQRQEGAKRLVEGE